MHTWRPRQRDLGRREHTAAPWRAQRRSTGIRRSRNDIRQAAQRFASEWASETYERREAQAFWADFLLVFGVQRRRVNAAFERYARRSSTGRRGFIDLLWPGMLLAEHKVVARLSVSETLTNRARRRIIRRG